MKQDQGIGSVLGTEVKAEWVSWGGPKGKLERTEAKDTLVWSWLCLPAFLSRNQCASTGHQNSSWTSRIWVPRGGGSLRTPPSRVPSGEHTRLPSPSPFPSPPPPFSTGQNPATLSPRAPGHIRTDSLQLGMSPSGQVGTFWDLCVL